MSSFENLLFLIRNGDNSLLFYIVAANNPTVLPNFQGYDTYIYLYSGRT